MRDESEDIKMCKSKSSRILRTCKSYPSGVVLCLSWLLSVQEFSISWVEKSLDVLASRFLKGWSGLACSANNALLYLSTRKGGHILPLPSTVHKKPSQVSRQSHLLTYNDPCVWLMAETALQKDLTLSRLKFRASREVRDAVIHNPDFTRKTLTSCWLGKMTMTATFTVSSS